MPLSSRPMTVALCDNCGKEKLSEHGEKPEGFYLQALYVDERTNLSTNAFACSPYCIQGAVEGALSRESMDDDAYSQAIKDLWARGKGMAFDTYPALPVVRADNPEVVIGSATRMLSKP